MNCRALSDQAYIPTDVEHLANVVTHGLWILPSIVGMWWMFCLSSNEIQRLTAIIYGLSLFVLFSVSTAFHTLAYSGKFGELKNVFHIGDRAVIYVFIASSYTPWLMLKDFNSWNITMLFIVWVSAMLGILYQYSYHEQYKWLETSLYVVIGITPSIIILEMKDLDGLYELTLGGVVYMAGVVFFKCDGLIPFAHAIWHTFVIIGAIVHFSAVCKYLLGPTANNSFEPPAAHDDSAL